MELSFRITMIYMYKNLVGADIRELRSQIFNGKFLKIDRSMFGRLKKS